MLSSYTSEIATFHSSYENSQNTPHRICYRRMRANRSSSFESHVRAARHEFNHGALSNGSHDEPFIPHRLAPSHPALVNPPARIALRSREFEHPLPARRRIAASLSQEDGLVDSETTIIMARGRLFSRKHEPAKRRSAEELEASPSLLVRLGLAFEELNQKLLIPATRPNPASGSDQDSDDLRRTPLIDINDVRKYLREKLAITYDVSTIPLSRAPPSSHRPGAHLHSPDDETNQSETTHLSSKHSYSSDASSLPTHDAAPGARPFDIGTVGHPIFEVNEPRRTISSSSAGPDQPSGVMSEAREPARRVSFNSPAGRRRQPATSISEVNVTEQEASTRVESSPEMEQKNTWVVEPAASDALGLPLVDMKELQEFFGVVVEVYRRIENWGLPRTSWENKMPWHAPPPKILAQGLQRPPQSFASEEDRLEYNRLARKRKKFLTGCPPTWSFMVANLALIVFLVSNPLG